MTTPELSLELVSEQAASLRVAVEVRVDTAVHCRRHCGQCAQKTIASAQNEVHIVVEESAYHVGSNVKLQERPKGTTSFKGLKLPQTKWYTKKKPFSGSVFHSVMPVRSVLLPVLALKAHLQTDCNSSTANYKIPFQWLLTPKLTTQQIIHHVKIIPFLV